MEKVPTRTCPKCGSGDYQFRSRKKVPPETQKGEPAATETKVSLQELQHEWKVRVPE